jgi:large subunit ribosomal protein L17
VRHRVYGKHLSRSKNERLALFRGLIRSLVLEGSLTTTEAKAKAIKPTVDKLVTAGRKNSPSSLRLIQSAVQQAEVIKKLLEEITPQYKVRNSGFTRTVRLGQRQGDGAMIVKMTWVNEIEGKKSKAETVESKEDEKPVEKKSKKTVKKEEVTEVSEGATK